MASGRFRISAILAEVVGHRLPKARLQSTIRVSINDPALDDFGAGVLNINALHFSGLGIKVDQ
jgi:hypothetical protein